MNKQLLQSVTGSYFLLAFLGCNSSQPAVVSGKDFQYQIEETAAPVFYNEPKASRSLSRNVNVPLLKVDAASVYRNMITYVIPDEELQPTVQADKINVFIDFPAGSTTINPKYGRNAAELERLKSQLQILLDDKNLQLKSVRLTGYASPDGNTKENERLAGGRAIQFKKYLQKQFDIPDNGLITVDWVGEDWDGLQSVIAGSGKEYANLITDILKKTGDSDSRRKQMQALNNGIVYKDIERSFFSRLRRMELNVSYEVRTVPDKNVMVEQIYSQPDKLSLSDMLQIAGLYRPGTEQYREIYEIIAYRFPDCRVSQLNAAAASLSLGDVEAAKYFLKQVENDPRALNNQGVLALMEGNLDEAETLFRKAMPQNPRLSRENLRIIGEMKNE